MLANRSLKQDPKDWVASLDLDAMLLRHLAKGAAVEQRAQGGGRVEKASLQLAALGASRVSPRCPALTAHCSLLITAHCAVRSAAHCSLLTAHCSLLTAHCSLLTSQGSRGTREITTSTAGGVKRASIVGIDADSR
eukprot:1340482-Rhodomonas_salina.2